MLNYCCWLLSFIGFMSVVCEMGCGVKMYEVGGTNESNFDFQIIEIASLSSERAFSTAGFTIFECRNRLSSEITSELIVGTQKSSTCKIMHFSLYCMNRSIEGRRISSKNFYMRNSQFYR